MSELFYPDLEMKIVKEEEEIEYIKEQEKVAKETKDLGYLRFLVDRKEKHVNAIYDLRLEKSRRLAKEAKRVQVEALKAKLDAEYKEPKKKFKKVKVDNGN